MASTMQLEFKQAMSDFKTMFPDMDRDVIEAVLRANQGAVDATIDQLLAMSTDNQNEKLRNELDASVSPQHSLINLNDSSTDAVNNKMTSGHIPLPTAQLIDTTDGAGVGISPNHTGASPKQRPIQQVNKSSKQSPLAVSTPTRKRNHGTRRWNPPILGPLPPSFLRITPTTGHDATRDFELPDEQFAMMLQNEEFMNQLRWNQEFMNALEKEQCGKAKTEDDAAFKERLKHMGKVSRKKFLQMARVFTWQRNKKATTAKQIDSLPLKEEPSDDEDHHQHQHQHQQVRK